MGSFAANKNSNVLLYCCSNLGYNTDKQESSGLVGPNSCKESSNLSIICCYSLEDIYGVSNETYGPFVGYNSVLDKSNLNIIMCYNNLIIDENETNFKYFIAPADSLSNSADDSDGNSGQHTAEQKAQHQRDKESNIFIDFCFNSSIKDGLTNSQLERQEFGSSLSNVSIQNSGRIDLSAGGNSNKFFSQKLSNYEIKLNGVNNNEFPYNNLFTNHNDKEVMIENNPDLFLQSQVQRFVDLKQNFDERLYNDMCNFTTSNNTITHYKLRNNPVNNVCANDNMNLDPSDSNFLK